MSDSSWPRPTETVVRTPGPLGALEGTMVSPAAAAKPVVLIIPGSGPTDRDGNGPGLAAAPYRLLAEALAARGVGSVRIDKRGLYGSHRAIADPNAVTVEDYAADVRVWVGVIRERSPGATIWILGHSEGGLVALVAAQDAADQCGVILVATPGRRAAEVLRDQLRAALGSVPLLDEALALIARLEASKRVGDAEIPDPLKPLFPCAVQGLLISLFALDPPGLIASLCRPVLVLQGLRDIQVGREDAEALKRAYPAATLTLLPDVDHVLKVATSNRRSDAIAAYGDPDRPLAPEVADAIASFVFGEGRSR